METKLFTITVFSEHTVGLLNQVTIIFTKRGLNIESLSGSESAIKGIHKITITLKTTEEEVQKVVKQIDKKVDVIKAYYNTDDELIHQEVALYKISTKKVLEQGGLERLLKKYNIQVLEITKDYIVLSKTGHYEETYELFELLKKEVGLLQFIRSGSVAITRSTTERLTDVLNEIENFRLEK